MLKNGYVLGLLFAILICSTASGEEIRLDYSFERPQVSTVSIDGATYHRIVMPGAPNGGDVGTPALPADGASILIPYGMEVVDVSVAVAETTTLGSGYRVEPMARPVKLSASPNEFVAPQANAAIYGSDDAFPGFRYERVTTQRFRGYETLILKLHPMDYRPQSGKLIWYPRLTVTVTLEDAKQSSNDAMFRGLGADEAEIRARVDNPEAAQTYLTAPKRGDRAYDLLIFTHPALIGDFEPLKTYHDANGIATEIHHTGDIGSSDPDDVRDYIRERYLNDGIQYVIIGGDDDVIPAKDLYVAAWSGGDVEYEMPGDLYFGCLDGTWNFDGDAYAGERFDGEGGSEVDLIAEVFVGRVPAGNSAEVTHWVNKNVGYLSGAGDYLQNVLMVGEHLGFGGIAEYAAAMMDQNVDGSSEDGYATTGISSSEYVVDRIYDRDWPGNDWDQDEFIDRINAGVHIVNHLGHGSPGWAMKTSSSDIIGQLNNETPFLAYSQTCLAGHFDGTDCWAEAATVKTDYAAFAVIMNARYGWGTGYTTDGPSQRFNREFWDAVYNATEAKPEIGRANADAKEDNLYRINEDCMRWIYYESNLFGDPTVAVQSGGVWFSSDTCVGWTPLDVSFQGLTGLTAESWIWDFGDGDSAFTQAATHTYHERGLYDVSIEIDAEGETRSRVCQAYIGALADTIVGDSLEAVPDESLEIIVNATNTVPLDLMIVPVEYGGDLDLDFDSFSTVGCRTEFFEYQTQLNFNPAKWRTAVKLQNSTTGSAPNLTPGSGPIIKLYFHLAGTPGPTQATPIALDGYSTYLPSFRGPMATYAPAIRNGVIAYASCCQGMRGNIDGDPADEVNITDLVFLVDHMFGGATAPPCREEANVNGDPSDILDVSDLVYLVNYMFQGGSAPAACF